MQRCETDFMGRLGAARARVCVPMGARAWVALLCIVAAMGVWTSSARALGYGQANVSFTGLVDAVSVAVDSANNVYAGDLNTPQVLESQAVNYQQFPERTLPFSGLFDPEAIAVDRAGDVFVADGFNKRVVEVPPGPVPPGGDQKTLPFAGLGEPFGLAVDAAGDVFVSDLTNHQVLELSPGGVQQTVPFTGLIEPEGLAVDSKGDLFVADATANRVLELSPDGTQQSVPFSGLREPTGVAVDSVGDVFVADHQNSRVLELPPGGSQQALPINGLGKPTGVAVDSAGDVFVTNGAGGVIELLQYPGDGSLAVAPGTAPAGSQIAVAGATPCPIGGAFSSTAATYALYSPAGAVVQSGTATLDGAGNWSGTLNIPTDATNGTAYRIGATCRDPEGIATLDYASGAFAVSPPLTGPAGPPGQQGQPGSNGLNGTDGLNGAAGAAGPQGATGPQGAAGPQGPAGPAGKSPSSAKITCQVVSKTTTCTITYQYTATDTARSSRIEATAKIHRRNVVLGQGTIHGHKLRITLKHLHPGHYRITVRGLKRHGKSVVLERTTLTVS